MNQSNGCREYAFACSSYAVLCLQASSGGSSRGEVGALCVRRRTTQLHIL